MLTQVQKDKLLKAVENAIHPGACMYTYQGQPSCVIGWLAHLEGVPIHELRLWGGSINTVFLKHEWQGKQFPLVNYSLDLLGYLQKLWDGSSPSHQPEFVRVEMRKIIEEWPLCTEEKTA